MFSLHKGGEIALALFDTLAAYSWSQRESSQYV